MARAFTAYLKTNQVGDERMIAGSDFMFVVNSLFSLATGIIARAGGGQTNATVLNAAVNVVTTVANAADSVMLPPSIVGLEITIINHGANSLQVFAQPTETIAASTATAQTASATGIALASGRIATYRAIADGQWKQMLTG